MSKYVLMPDGSIQNAKGKSIKKSSFAEKMTKNTLAKESVSDVSYTKLPTFSEDFYSESSDGNSVIRKENFTVSGSFVSGDRNNNFLANPSFGGDVDEKIEYYTTFNDYLNQDKVFATELEMAAGIELSTFGFADFTKYIFWFDYLIEAAVYIAAIEGILLAENLIFKNESHVEQDYQMQLGNYGPVNYTSITRYIHEFLRYPKDKRTKKDSSGGAFERIGAFYVGLSFYVNSDPLLFMDKIKDPNSGDDIKSLLKNDLLINKISGLELLLNAVYYIMESVLNLSSIGQNRLDMLIRRFNQKSDWYINKLYKAKPQENAAEKYLVQLSYYYVTFIVERMNIGLKLKKYYKNNKSTRNKLVRSGRSKDSLRGFNSVKIENNVATFNKIEGNSKLDNKSSLSMSALPQAFIMPASMRKSMAYSGLSESLVEEHVKNYFIHTDKPQQRISPETVKAFERFYEKEIVPFYFQDLRTNEVIGFHAFVDSYSDSFSPQYTETSPGYGRVDKVYHYVNTARQIQMSFTLVSMSKEDHDLMWYQINKIVSMVYPQWSRGFKNKKLDPDEKLGLEFPFTQVPTASPMIRIRFGDVLKSNYTKHAVSKIHGMGQGKETMSIFELQSPEVQNSIALEAPIDISNNLKSKNKYYVIPGEYYCKNNKGIEFVHTIRDLHEIEILENISKEVKFKVIDFNPSRQLEYLKEVEFFIADPKSILEYYLLPKIDQSGTFDSSSENKKAFDSYINAYDKDGNINNPLTAAYETTVGKGLAGFIGSLSINSQEQLWETSVEGSKAPMAVKLDISFNPIHDIAPGLDADGAMRAPVYNTGRIINSMYGDVYEDD